jgi:uncharacterized protein YrrD
MAHVGRLGNQAAPYDVRNVRGSVIRDSHGEKIGNIKDVILDYDTMETRYIVVNSDGWLKDATYTYHQTQ